MAEAPRVALILGAAVWPDGPSPSLRRRTQSALKLWQEGEVDHLVPCGGLGRHPPAEASAMADLLHAAGVPAEAITCEYRSTNTAENLRFALPILDALGTRAPVIVTDAYHMPRARIIARRLGLAPRPAPVPPAGGHWPTILRGTLREIPACLAYMTRVKNP